MSEVGAAPKMIKSLLFAPGSDERKLLNALHSRADAIVADLEDAVAPGKKAAARDTVARVFASRPREQVSRLVRVNAATTPLFADDIALVAKLEVDGVVLPKASPAALERLGRDGPPVLAIVETAAGLRAAYQIASSPRVFALMLGAADLGAELDLQPREDGFELMYARSKLVVDSAAAGIQPPFDGVHLAIADEVAVEAETRLARSLGMGGKACIHPSQVPVVNRVFLPSTAEVEWARRVVSAADSAEAEGRGAVNLDGEMIDAPVVKRARSILEHHQGA